MKKDIDVFTRLINIDVSKLLPALLITMATFKTRCLKNNSVLN